MSSINKILNYADYLSRRIINSATYCLQKKQIKTWHNAVSKIDVHSVDYPAAMATYADSFLKNKDLLCNFEDTVLKKIASSDKPIIFVMNHSKQSRDPALMLLFNALFNIEQLENGKIVTPAKIIMNKNIIESQVPMMQDIFKKFGAVGFDIIEKNNNNFKLLISLIRSYIKKENNIFIFPEGKNCVKKHLPFDKRFQDGVSGMVKQIVSLGETAKVVPLGFSYGNNKKLLGSLYIGEPLYFKKSGDRILTSSANVHSEFASSKLKQKFNKKFITEIKETKDISFQIIENMKICMAEAQKRFLNSDKI